jgi:hypothetical protein
VLSPDLDKLRRLLSDLLHDPHVPDGRERLDTIEGAKHAASLLFRVIMEHHGIAIARWVFAQFGPPSARKSNQFRNAALISRYFTMQPEPNIKRLARELAEENRNPRQRGRFGPRGTDPVVIKRHIDRLLAKEKKRGLPVEELRRDLRDLREALRHRSQ